MVFVVIRGPPLEVVLEVSFDSFLLSFLAGWLAARSSLALLVMLLLYDAFLERGCL